ncbi:DNA glycosylase, partial [Tanacetum coccineum]
QTTDEVGSSSGLKLFAADSTAFEALRRAHVNEILDAIRGRGMNNLLADRLKDIPNRLLKDHGPIYLEWLRDAPQYKAKLKEQISHVEIVLHSRYPFSKWIQMLVESHMVSDLVEGSGKELL